jgi:hypothetical protein
MKKVLSGEYIVSFIFLVVQSVLLVGNKIIRGTMNNGKNRIKGSLLSIKWRGMSWQ